MGEAVIIAHFVGGPIAGELHEMPEGVWEWRVPRGPRTPGDCVVFAGDDPTEWPLYEHALYQRMIGITPLGYVPFVFKEEP
jgi:hypothetical protein